MEMDNYTIRLLDGHTQIGPEDDPASWGTDITDYVGDKPQLKDVLNALSTEFSMTYFRSEWDKYVPDLKISPGMQITLANNDNPLFTGRIVSVGLDGSVEAYESGWFLGKSSIVWQATDTKASEVIKSVIAAAGVSAGAILEIDVMISQTWIGASPAQIIDDVLAIASEATGETYQYYVRCGRFNLRTLPTDAKEPNYKPAENVREFPITWALESITGSESVDSMTNHVSVVGQSDDTIYVGAIAKNDESIKKYGLITRILTQTTDPGDSELRKIAVNELTQNDALNYSRTVKLWGSDEVMAGEVLLFNSPEWGLKGNYRVISVTHEYGQAGHTMTCEVEAVSADRSTSTDDSVVIYGLPDDLGQTKVNAEDTTSNTDDGTTTTGYYMQGNKLIDRVMQWADKIVKYAAKWQVPADLVGAIIYCESSGYANPGTRTDGADRTTSYGLMQVKPVYMTRFNPLITSKPTDPDVNIDCGCGFLRYCLEQRYGNKGGVSAYTEMEWRGALGTYGNGSPKYSNLNAGWINKRFNLCPNQLSSYSSCKAGNYKVTTTVSSSVSTSGNNGALRDKLVSVAKGMVGWSEMKAGAPNAMYKFGYGGRDNQWCGWFVNYCLDKAGVPKSLVSGNGSSQSYKNQAIQKGKWHPVGRGYVPRKADILVWTRTSTTGHVGIVEYGISADTSMNIEGNAGTYYVLNRKTWFKSTGIALSGFFSWWE